MPPRKRKAASVSKAGLVGAVTAGSERKTKQAKQLQQEEATEPGSSNSSSGIGSKSSRGRRGGKTESKVEQDDRKSDIGEIEKGGKNEVEVQNDHLSLKESSSGDVVNGNDSVGNQGQTAALNEPNQSTESTENGNVLKDIDIKSFPSKIIQRLLVPNGSEIEGDIPGLDVDNGNNNSIEAIVTIPGAISDICKTIYTIHEKLGLHHIRLLYPEPAFYEQQHELLKKLTELEKQTGLLEIAKNCLLFSSFRVISLKMPKMQVGSDVSEQEKTVLESNTLQVLCVVMDWFEKAGDVDAKTDVLYTPAGIFGQFGHPDKYLRSSVNQSLAKNNPYIEPSCIHATSGAGSNESVSNAAPSRIVASLSSEEGLVQARKQCERDSETIIPGQHISLQVTIPNDFVGAMIGKGGSKILEMQQSSGSTIVIEETVKHTQRGDERVMTCTGTPESNMSAAMMIYKRVDIEKQFQMRRS